MKALILLPMVLLMASQAALAAEDTEFAAWMKTADTATRALKSMDQKTGIEATRNAERLEVIYENMVGFWRRYNAKDAVKWSEEGKAAAGRLAAAAGAGDMGKATAAFNVLGGTCQSCHDARRERLAEGRFRIRFEPPPAPAVKR